MDLRLKPGQKPKPANYPKHDPFFFLEPLYDSYVTSTRPASITNSILNPILAPLPDLPLNILLVIPTIDILLDEQLKFAKRLQEDVEKQRGAENGRPRRSVQSIVFEDCWHGWLECRLRCSIVYEGACS